MEEEKLNYFCYQCDKSFNSAQQAYCCPLCDSCAIEQVQAQKGGDKQKFEVYELKAPKSSNQSYGVLENITHPRGAPVGRTVVSIVSTTITQDLGSFAEGSYLGNLLRQFMRDGNRMTPATEQQISNLKKIQHVKQCSICQSLGEEDQISQKQPEKQQQKTQGFRLTCNHTFHEDCIRPWFQRTNTCPVCRKNIAG